MKPLTRRIVVTAAGGLVLLLAYSLIYRWGMATFQGEDIGYVRSLQVVVEILTTAGFGGDSPWSSTGMSVIVIGMNVTGVLLVFFAIPYFVIPLLKRALRTEAPTETDLSGHVIVCADSPREPALEAEIGGQDVPELFVKQDESRVMELVRDGVDAIHGDPETAATLTAANVEQARAMIVDINDEVNANVVLTGRRLNEHLQIVSVVENSDTAQYHSYAGADDVIQPRVAVGKRLAMKAKGTQFGEYADDREPSITLSEVLIESGSDLIGQTLAECRFKQRFGVTVLGGWFHGEFVAPVAPGRRLVEHAVLLVAGEPADIPTIRRGYDPQNGCTRAVVAGYGVVGRTAAETLAETGVDVTVVDTVEKPGVDVVGDITEPETLREAKVSEADSLVLGLSRDSLVVYSGLVVEDHAPTTTTLARADDVNYVQKCYDAGIEYTLSLSEVTAHMATARLFDSPAQVETIEQFRIVQTRVPAFAGQSLEDTEIRSTDSVQVVAVERDGQLHSDLDPSFAFRVEDTLILAGKERDLAAFERP